MNQAPAAKIILDLNPAGGRNQSEERNNRDLITLPAAGGDHSDRENDKIQNRQEEKPINNTGLQFTEAR